MEGDLVIAGLCLPMAMARGVPTVYAVDAYLTPHTVNRAGQLTGQLVRRATKG